MLPALLPTAKQHWSLWPVWLATSTRLLGAALALVMQAQLHAKEIDAVQLAAAHRADLAVITARFSEREARLLQPLPVC
jgi:hypothetical protein